MALYRLREHAPQVPASAYVAAEASLIGQVTLGERASVWFGAVARGDNEPITIGTESNIQEGAVLHADPGYPLKIGNNVTVGHQVMLHGCTIGDGSLIGIQAVVMNGAVIGKQCLVGAGAIVTERKTFPDRMLIIGAPAKAMRELTDAEVANLASAAAGYVSRGGLFRDELERVG
jgi:carbonic anhydrase/acetyltransferase-like protein (isoleucine patch superfamily)